MLGRRRMSQAQLARTLGQSQMWVSDRLRGIQPIDLDDMNRIARALGVGVYDLMPPPELAATARTMASYPMPSSRMTQPGSRPRDNRPNGHPGTATAGSPGRTTYLSRGNRRNRG